MPHPIASAHYGERVVEVYPYRPHPAIYDGTCYYVEVDGVRVYAESFATAWVDVGEAKQAAEAVVGAKLEWREEA